MRFLHTVREDYRAVRRHDPSIPPGLAGLGEIVLCTPGFWALLAHRLNHLLHTTLRIPVLPRLLSLVARWITGIEIHPGARVGGGVFIDHGMGVVIGQTAVVEDGVTLFQGVTLGATGHEKGSKRHPTVRRGAFIGCGARILGDVVVGENARVGAGAIVVEDVPPDTTVVGFPAFVIRQGNSVRRSARGMVERLEHLEDECRWLRSRVRELEERPLAAERAEVA